VSRGCLRNPQDALLDRRMVYRLLVEKNIPVPTHIIVERDGALAAARDLWPQTYVRI
jgi:hypothetical protein